MNFQTQYYMNIPLKLIDRNYENKKAKRFIINHTNQNVWIPDKHLLEDGTIKENQNLNYIFFNTQGFTKLRLAGIGYIKL